MKREPWKKGSTHETRTLETGLMCVCVDWGSEQVPGNRGDNKFARPHVPSLEHVHVVKSDF